MQWKTPMFEPMRKLMGRCGRSPRKTMEAQRSQLLRRGFGEMTRVLSRWIDPKLMAPENEGNFSRVRCFDFARPCKVSSGRFYKVRHPAGRWYSKCRRRARLQVLRFQIPARRPIVRPELNCP